MNKRVLILKLFAFILYDTLYSRASHSVLAVPMLEHGLVKLKPRQSAVRGPWRGWRAGSERARGRS